MRLITFLFCFIVCSITINICQAQVYDNRYTDTLRSINERIRIALAQDNLSATAQGYYDRAMHNFSVHIRDQDVINDLISSARIYRSTRDDYGFYKARMALANFYIDEEIFLDEAIKLTAEAYQFYTDQDAVFDKAKAITQLGKAYQRKLDYDKAIAYVEKGLKSSIELGDKEMELSNRVLITRLLGNLGNVEKVLEQGSYIINMENELELNLFSAEANFLMGSNLLMDDQIKKATKYLKSSVALNANINDLAYQSNSAAI